MEFLRDREAFTQLANKAGLSRRDNWYEIDNRTDIPEILIYSEIGYIGATAEEFVAELRDITAPKIKVRINSMGGSIFEGIAIFNALRSHPARIITQVDSMAASIASVIAQAGEERIMIQRSQMLIHEAHGIALGATASDMRELADILEQQTELLADIYAEAKGDKRSRSHFLTLMRAKGSNLGTLLSDTEAVKEGLADEVVTPKTKTETKAPEPVTASSTPTDFSDLFNTDPEDFEWSEPIKESV
jgi:ATP-dependent protease ClpP protease subunit